VRSGRWCARRTCVECHLDGWDVGGTPPSSSWAFVLANGLHGGEEYCGEKIVGEILRDTERYWDEGKLAAEFDGANQERTVRLPKRLMSHMWPLSARSCSSLIA